MPYYSGTQQFLAIWFKADMYVFQIEKSGFSETAPELFVKVLLSISGTWELFKDTQNNF